MAYYIHVERHFRFNDFRFFQTALTDIWHAIVVREKKCHMWVWLSWGDTFFDVLASEAKLPRLPASNLVLKMSFRLIMIKAETLLHSVEFDVNSSIQEQWDRVHKSVVHLTKI